MLNELLQQAEQIRQKQAAAPQRLRVCMAASCLALGSQRVKDALESEVKNQEGYCQVKGVGCLGLCSAGTLVSASVEGKPETLLQKVQPEDAPMIVRGMADQLPQHLQCPNDAPFFTKQVRIVTENCGRIDPEQIDDYIAAGGYQALLKVLSEMTPAHVLEEVVKSGLRGRGGAGYPTGLKWRTVAKAPGSPKYVVCNADEGDPGAFMDRTVLESDPHRVLEGMAIAGYAVGASQGYIYIRAEYPLALERLKIAIRQAEQQGLLGARIGGTPFGFHLEIRVGAGAYVCGEETALISSIEGGRGTPHPRPPYPAERGVFGQPTLINNVETLANIPSILRNGGEWYASLGTEKSKGTKVFALAGAVANVGLIEVPMGITLRELVFELGGGLPHGAFKAVQTGGPTGGCIPTEYLDTPVDYENLTALGSMMGSGGMIVLDSSTCMVDLAKFFMGFCRDESCGKCVPCRVGTVEMYALLDKISRGEAGEADLALLEELCDLVKRASLCGLGQGAPSPVLSTLRYFRDEYLAHLKGECPAGVCATRKGVTA